MIVDRVIRPGARAFYRWPILQQHQNYNGTVVSDQRSFSEESL